MRRLIAVAASAAIMTAGLAVPAQAASQGEWEVTAFFSKSAWKAGKPKAAILNACRTGTGGSPFKIGTPVQVLDANEQPLGSAAVSKVKLWKEGGRYICKFIANVPVAPSPTPIVYVQVADTPALMTSTDEAQSEGWHVDFWPI